MPEAPKPLAERMKEERARYMANEITHAHYYRWLARECRITPGFVVKAIGADDIKKSRDPHFNDIPLRRWDGLHVAIPFMMPARLPWSLSDTVCCAKQVARDWLNAQHAPGKTYRTPEEHGAVSARGRIVLDVDAVARGESAPWLVFAYGDCVTHCETLGVARKYLERHHNLFVSVPDPMPCQPRQS